MVFAAIDTGSNAVRMAVSEPVPGSSPAIIEVIRIPIRLGKDVFSSGFVKEKTASDLLSAFRQFRKAMERYGVIQYKAVATSALREAKNADHLVAEIMKSSQIQVQIIDGLEEARLVQLAISRYFGLSDLNALIVDIGGGSVEVIRSFRGQVKQIDSLKLGTVRLLKDFDPDHEFDQMHDRVRQIVGRFYQRAGVGQRQDSDKMIVTGGNARCLGRLGVEFLGSRSHLKMSHSELESLLTLLHSLSTRARREELGLKPDRADVIMPAALIIYEFMVMGQYQSLEIPPVGLKNGVLYDLEKNLRAKH